MANNPIWFKRWINGVAPIGTDSKQAIWFRFPNAPASLLANDTLYVMTYGQQQNLCSSKSYQGEGGANNIGPYNGCVDLSENVHKRPGFLDEYASKLDAPIK